MPAFKPVIVTTTAPTREEAEKIGGLLLEKHLAACVQYETITSQYLWNGEICRDDEIRITSKPRATATAKSKKPSSPTTATTARKS